MTRERTLRLLILFYGLAILVALGSLIVKDSWFKKFRKSRPSDGKLAIVRIQGPIRSAMSESAFSAPDAEEIARRLHKLSKNDDVKAIVLRINSPGGSIGAVQEIHREIERCKAKGKKIVASLGDVAASGGYYLAAPADLIMAEPGTITGSIGVIMQFPTLEGLFQKLGVKLQVVKSGEHKDIGSPARELMPEERKILQAGIDDAYQQFVEAVSQGRKKSPEVIKPLADGRIFTGRQAKAAGLVDELGSRQDAIDAAIKLAGLSADARIIRDEERGLPGLMHRLSATFRQAGWQVLEESLSTPTIEYRWR